MKSYIIMGMLLLCGGLYAKAENRAMTVADNSDSTFCRFVPERKGDFAWENDRVAFRAYGKPTQKKPHAIVSGFDCFLKRVSYSVINKWYAMNQKGKSYHRDWGEGLDCYYVGASRGCGGSAVFYEGRYYAPEYFERSEVLENNRTRSVFRLYYAPMIIGKDTVREVKTITIEKGNHYFKCEDEWMSSLKLKVLGVGIAQHGGRGTVTGGRGWMSYWEPMQQSELGLAVWCHRRNDAGKEMEKQGEDKDANLWLHVKMHHNKATYYAGFSWAKAGYHTSNEAWTDYVGSVSKHLKEKRTHKK